MADEQRPYPPGLANAAGELVFGLARAPVDLALGLPAALGATRLQRPYTLVRDKLAGFFNATPDPTFAENPAAALGQAVGGAALGAPLGATLRAAPAVVRGGLNVVGGALGFTPALTPGGIALASGANAAVGYGVEKLADAAYPQNVVPNDLVPADASGVPSDLVPAAPLDKTDAYARTPRGTATPDGDIPSDLMPEGNTTARNIVEALPWLGAAAVAAGAGGAGLRLMRAGASDAAHAATLVAPGLRDAAPNIAEPTMAGRAYANIVDNAGPTRSAIAEWEQKGTVNPAQAEELRGVLEVDLRAAVRSNKIGEAMRTGELSPTHRITPPTQVLDAVAKLDAGDPARAAALRDALVAGDELDNRRSNANRGMYQTGTTGEGSRVNFSTVDEADLQRRHTAVDADPELAALKQQYYATNRTLAQMLYDNGAIDQATMMKYRNGNANWVHTLATDMGDDYNSVMTRRNRNPGDGVEKAQNPIDAQIEAIQQSLSVVHRNNAVRQLAETSAQHMQQTLQANPNARLWSGGVFADDQRRAARPGMEKVRYRDGGKPMVWEVTPAVAAMVRGGERAVMPFMTSMNRLYMSTITGTLALAGGTAFAPVSALMGSFQMMSNRPMGTRVGSIDGLVQKASGGRFGMPVDPTLYGHMVSAVTHNMASQAAAAVSNVTRRDLDTNGALVKMFGPQRMQRFSDRMADAYITSLLHQERAVGVSGTGQSHGFRTDTLADANIRQLSPSYANSAPSAVDWAAVRKDPRYLQGWIEQVGGRVAPADMQRAWGTLTQMLDIIASAPQSAIYRQNRNVPGIESIVRRSGGDPAAYGNSKAMQKLTSIVPYGNIMVQGINSYIRAIQKEGAPAIVRMTAVAVTPVALALTSAIIADTVLEQRGEEPRYLKDYLMRPSQDAGRVPLYIPGVDTQNTLIVPADPGLSPFMAMANAGLVSLLGADDMRFLGPEGSPVRHAFASLMQDRAWQQIMGGVRSAGGQISLPSVIDTGVKLLTGVDVANTLDLTNPRMSAPRQQGVPGYSEDNFLNDPVHRHVATVMEGLFGAVGKNITEFARTYGYTDRTAASPVGAVANQYALNARGSVSLVAPLLQPNRRLPQRDAVGEALAPIERKLADIKAGIGSVTREGTVGSGRFVERSAYGTGMSGVNPDMRPLLMQVNGWANRALAPLDAQLKKSRDELIAVQGAPAWRAQPERLREEVNRITTAIRERAHAKYAMVRDFEDALSTRLGRRIRIESIDPNRGIDQFTSLNQ